MKISFYYFLPNLLPLRQVSEHLRHFLIKLVYQINSRELYAQSTRNAINFCEKYALDLEIWGRLIHSSLLLGALTVSGTFFE